MKAWLRITRIPLAPTAPLDAIVCALLALAAAGRSPLGFAVVDWLTLAATSFCLYCAGMAANDLADRKRDATIAAHRPLPSEALSPTAVAIFVGLTIALAIGLGGGPMGNRGFVCAAAVFAMAYNFGLKALDLPGAVCMGLVRFCNASIAVAPLVLLEDGAPAWVFCAPAVIGLYSTAITLLSTTEDQPSRSRLHAARVMAAIAFAGAGALSVLATGLPTLGVFVAFGVTTSTLAGRTPRPGPPKQMVLEMLLGLYFLEYVLATAGDGGALWIDALGLVAAYGLVRATWWSIKWLAR